ncbi:iron-sulfur cluster co-chaperone protein HscB [Microplitis demolitor]|uniref:iron-sulfur cluster co-chaperone protein HscB n=1 Tax=Microplitis demolitor TaxID=69319 RepID=UPI0004CCE3BA|nr:iron-sulfur cluster co-chaperone protein HscB [Microplitis demolitor]
MGSRLVSSLNRTVNCARIVWSKTNSKKIHAVCGKKDVDLEYKFSRVSLYSSGVPKKCWQCNYPFKSELFCQKCETVQEPPEQLNYFEILGVEKSFDINVTDVQTKYRKLQSKLHPDKFGNKSKKEQQYSEFISSLLNKAYATLSNPLDRGMYLLKLNNLSTPEGTTDLDPVFLMEIMERNEAIEEAGADKDKIDKLSKENHEILTTLSKEVSEAFKNGDIKKAHFLLLKMKYFTSIDDRLKNLRRNLGIVA